MCTCPCRLRLTQVSFNQTYDEQRNESTNCNGAATHSSLLTAATHSSYSQQLLTAATHSSYSQQLLTAATHSSLLRTVTRTQVYIVHLKAKFHIDALIGYREVVWGRGGGGGGACLDGTGDVDMDTMVYGELHNIVVVYHAP